MDSIDILTLIVQQYGSAGVVAGLLAIKGCASVVANNFHTEEWGKAGKVIDWLASNNKKAKLTGSPDTDKRIIEDTVKAAPKKLLMKLISKIS